MTINVAVVDDASVAIRGAIDVLGSSGYHFLGSFAAVQDVWIPREVAGPVVVVADPFTAAEASGAAQAGTAGGSPMTAVSAVAGHAAVLIMSACTGAEHVRQALAAGARGYVSKQTDVATLLAAVGALGVGGLYFGDTLRHLLVGPPEGESASQDVKVPAAITRRLTPREADVLAMVAEGLTHKQIGSRLGLTKATVDTYVHRIRQKVGAVNKAGLTRIAMGLNLVRNPG